jgi:hypothetical protein
MNEQAKSRFAPPLHPRIALRRRFVFSRLSGSLCGSSAQQQQHQSSGQKSIHRNLP